MVLEPPVVRNYHSADGYCHLTAHGDRLNVTIIGIVTKSRQVSILRTTRSVCLFSLFVQFVCSVLNETL